MLPLPRIAFQALLPMLAIGSTLASELDILSLDRGGGIAYQRALGSAATERRLNANPDISRRARGIANRLVIAAPTIDAASKRYTWAVNVVSASTPDVRAFPGGRLIVNDGLVTQTEFTDEEVAAILANALAHSLLGHDTSRIASRVSTPASPDPNRRALEVADATPGALAAPRYSTAEIAAADQASVQMLSRAGYDPRAAGSAWRRLARSSAGIIERAPVDSERLAALDAAIRAAVPLYEETRAKAAAAQAKQPPPPPTTRPAKVPPLSR